MRERENAPHKILKKIENVFYASPDPDVADLIPLPRADGSEGPRWNPREVGFVLPSDFVDGLVGKTETDEEWNAKVADMNQAMARVESAGLTDGLLSSNAPKERRRAAIALFLSDLFPPKET